MADTTKTTIFNDDLGADDVNETDVAGLKIIAPNGDATAIELSAAGLLTSKRGSDPLKTYAEIGGGLDTTAIHVDESDEISGITEKTVVADADLVVIEDSAASNAKKRVQVTNLPLGDIDGGAAATVYTASQIIDGGTA